MRNMITIALLTLAACAADEPPLGPPHVGESELLGSGKADGALALGTSKVNGQQTGYRGNTTPIRCYSGGTVAMDVDYENHSLPWGVELSLWRGMAGEEWCGGCEPPYHGTFDWEYHQVDAMKPSGPWQWSVRTEAHGYADDAGGKFTAMKYVVRIRMPDGSIRWDNGGSPWGYYQLWVPEPKCDPSWTPFVTYDSPITNLPVFTVTRY